MALGHLKLLQKALDPETKALKRSPHADQMSLGGYRAIRKQLFLTGVPVWNGIDDPYAMRIEDARGREAEFTLDRNGFALVKAPTAVAISIRPRKSSGFTIQKSSCARSWTPSAYSSSTTMWAMPGGRARARRSAGSSGPGAEEHPGFAFRRHSHAQGEKRDEREEKEKHFYISERAYGAFQRSFALPNRVDRDKIAADPSKCVLNITLPKTAEAQESQKKIEVKAAT